MCWLSPLAQAMCPPAHTATASTSTLCKLLTWHQQGAWQKAAAAGQQPRLLHQADWLASLLHGDRWVGSAARDTHVLLHMDAQVGDALLVPLLA